MKHKILIVICILISITYIYDIKKQKSDYVISYNISEVNTEPYKNLKEQGDFIIASIQGEVMKPNMYSLKKGATLKDIIDIAGGFTSYAKTDELDLKRPIKDKEYIVINKLEISGKPKIIKKEDEKGLININKATLEELKELPGISDAISVNIIEYREKFGEFKKKEHIKNVKRIGEKTYEAIKDLITI